jgi:hypothetical protein
MELEEWLIEACFSDVVFVLMILVETCMFVQVMAMVCVRYESLDTKPPVT